MRFTLCVAAILAASSVLAQNPQIPPTADKLDIVLVNWERAMGEIRSMVANCTRTTVDKVFQSTETLVGTAKFIKSQRPGDTSKASLELHHKEQAGVFEKFVCSGNVLYEYAPQTKVIRKHQLPPTQNGAVADDNFLSFLFGMKATEAKKRYKLTYVPGKDTWYHYIRIEPILAPDRADFTEARLVLFQKDSMPRQLWFQQPNGNEVTWDFQRIVNNAPIDPQEFNVVPPNGWRLQEMPPQPRVIRQNQ